MNPSPRVPASDLAETKSYDSHFFADTAVGSLSSARRVLSKLFDLYRPTAVVDIGCGSGAWLAAAEELGATKLVGLDGPWVDPAALLSKQIAFAPVNLEGDFAPKVRFDLCISVEVAEHVSEENAHRFVKNLCLASDIIVFSAAIPLQGGVMHINEQWQSYWAKLFADEGYDCYDIFRPQLWTNMAVESWYRQNLLLYCKREHPLAAKAREKCALPVLLDIVHPEIYRGNLENYQRIVEEPTLAACCLAISRWGRRQLRRLFSRK